MSSSPIYKINTLTKENNIRDIFVFAGLTKENAKLLTDKIRQTPEEHAAEYFTAEEIEYIKENNVNVEIVPMYIYADDTIDIVKRKILIATDNTIPFDAIYLFGKVVKQLSPVVVYQTLTQNGRIELTKLRLMQFLINIGFEELQELSLGNKDVYTYDDIMKLGLDHNTKEWEVSIPIGQHFVAVEGTYPFSVNPFNVEQFDPLLINSVSDMVTTTNAQLLMSHQQLINNNIFMCLTTDVIEYISDNQNTQTNEETAFRIYYPFLTTKNIVSIDEYNDKLTGLLKESKKLITPMIVKQMDAVELLNNIYEKRHVQGHTSVYEMVYDGVDTLEFIMHPQYSFNLPLDIVFKLLHSTEDVPMIKYNPGKGQEKMFRMYADKTATDGRKIPYLSKGDTFKIAKVIAKKKCVSAVIQAHQTTPHMGRCEFHCEFADNGDITIKVNCSKILVISEIEDLVRDNVNPVISVVADFLAQSGYQFDIFDSLTSERIEILGIDYKLGFPIRKALNLSKKQGCFANIFSIIEEEKDKPVRLQYKRVSNFSEMESLEAFMITQMKRGMEINELVMTVMTNFQMEEKTVRERMSEMINNMQVVQNAFQNKRFRIKNNPGFPVTITRNVTTNTFDIVVNDIDNIEYLQFIRIFIDSVLRIAQEQTDTTDVEKTKITAVCRGKKDETSVVEDIVAGPEKALPEHTAINIVAEEIEMRDEAEQEEYLNFLLGDEDEDEEGKGEGNNDIDGDSDGVDVEFDDEEIEFDEGEGEDEDEDKPISYGGDGDGDDNVNDKSAEPIDVTGLNLGHPNPFFKRMQQRDPALFVTKTEGNFKAYSKVCQWNARRQPVILTQEEKDRIDKKHPGSYQNAVKYGTTPENQNWYICPRYWSLSRNTSLTEEEVKSGKFGKLIKNQDEPVKPGEDIFEFGHYDAKGNYEQFYPGFTDPSSHPDGFCMPCCFKNWSGPKQKKLRDQCAAQGMDLDVDKQAKVETKAKAKAKAEAETTDAKTAQEKLKDILDKKGVKQTKPKLKPKLKLKIREDQDQAQVQELVPEVARRVEADNYIMGSDKFPLGQGRWGFLVPVLQMFFNYDSKKCMVSPSNPTLKKDTPCILRRGVEASKNQSFIAAIADAYAEFNDNQVLSIKSMKQRIISSLTLSNFATYQNGNLINLFYNHNQPTSTAQTIHPKYKNEEIYIELSYQKNGMKLVEKMINAFENFIAYLEDDKIQIDYTYLWDIICIPNKKLFPSGINLVILEVPNDDITAGIQLLCPTNQYIKSPEPFDFNKGSLILFKNGNYYEPIYTMRDTGDAISLTRFFSLKSSALLAPIKSLLTLAKSATNDMCVPMASMPRVYNFRSNISAQEIYRLLMLRDIQVKQQIINYSGQTIGLIASVKGVTGYIPTQASAPISISTLHNTIDDETQQTNNAIPKILIDEYPTQSYLSYTQTVDFLNTINQITKQRIPCKPKMRFEEDGLTIGIITETNQTIMLREPEHITDDTLPVFDENMSVSRDVTSEISDKVDDERVLYVNKIRLETEFYNVFRNTIRVLLSRYEKRSIRNQIEMTVKSPFLTYVQKLDEVTTLLRSISKGYIMWDDKFDIEQLEKESLKKLKPQTCALFNEDKCGQTPMCSLHSETATCLTKIPKTNILTNGDNEKRYYIKMADELVRYNRIRNFIFKPQAFLSFGKISYDLDEDELLIMQSMLTPEYFDSLEERITNKYVANNTYQTTQPVESVPYSSVYELDSLTMKPGKEKQEQEQTGLVQDVDELINADNDGVPSKLDMSDAKTFDDDAPPQLENVNITGKWRTYFPTGSTEIKFITNSRSQTFKPLLLLLHRYKPELGKIKLVELKEILIGQYETKFVSQQQIKSIWKNEKKTKAVQILEDGQTIDTIIMSSSYHATPIDWILLAKHLKLPIMLFSGTKLVPNEASMLKTYESTYYIYVKVPSLNTSEIPSYRIVISKDGLHVNTLSFSEEARKEIEAVPVFDITEYMKSPTIKIVRKAKPKVVKKQAQVDEQTIQPEVVQEQPITTLKRIVKRKPKLKIVE